MEKHLCNCGEFSMWHIREYGRLGKEYARCRLMKEFERINYERMEDALDVLGGRPQTKAEGKE